MTGSTEPRVRPPSTRRLNVTARKHLGLNPTRAPAAQKPLCRLVSFPAQKVNWMRSWSTSSTGAQLRANTSSPPGIAFTRFRKSLSRRQSTLLTRVRTGACDLGAYKALFESEGLFCAC